MRRAHALQILSAAWQPAAASKLRAVVAVEVASRHLDQAGCSGACCARCSSCASSLRSLHTPTHLPTRSGG